MSAPAFTPGPWRVDLFKPCDIIAGGDYLKRTFVAFAGRGTDIPSEANARLIAAAPSLYEALAALRGNIGCASLVRNPNGIKLRADADAALAQARGESA